MPLYLKDKDYRELNVEQVLDDGIGGVDMKVGLFNIAQLGGNLAAQHKMGMLFSTVDVLARNHNSCIMSNLGTITHVWMSKLRNITRV